MCLNPEQVKLAVDFHAPIQETCCKKDAKGKKWQCPFFVGAAIKGNSQPSDVFIAAHQMMFHEQERFGEFFAAIGIDESFWKAGLWGIGKDESNWTIEIDQIANA